MERRRDPLRLGLRGGSWSGSGSLLAASFRSYGNTESRLVGFRVARRIPACQNGVDDDGDGGTDLDDVGCAGAGDLDERDPLLPCDDGADNDGDGLADFPGDRSADRVVPAARTASARTA